MIKLTSIALCIFAVSARAEIYHWTDASGQTHYSDTAPKDKPDLTPQKITIPTAMPATKIQTKVTEKTGPTVIVIGSPEQRTGCISQKINSTDNNAGIAMSTWQDQEWKNCHGMR